MALSSSSPASLSSPQPISGIFHLQESDIIEQDNQLHSRTLHVEIVLFCTAFIVAVLFLYLRSTCHSLDLPPTPENRNGGETGLDRTVIRMLPVKAYRRDLDPMVAESECSICLGGFEDGDKVKLLPACGHFFHCQCVDRWLCTESSCPLCRASLRVDSVVIASNGKYDEARLRLRLTAFCI